MKIKKLFDGLDYEWISDEKCEEIENITHIANSIKNNDCFINLHSNTVGMEKILKAIKNGAKLIVVDKYIAVPKEICVIKVSDIRHAYSILAKNYYLKASDKMKMIAVVGTNGKSTTSYLIWSILNASNLMCGLIGTGYYMVGKKKFSTNMTTPDPMQLHYILNVMANSGVKVVVMEVSSHAIYFKKVDGIKFKIGVFTNLSQDHLDFFGSMSKLEETKHSFFLNGNAEISLINIDDKSGARLAGLLSLPNVTIGIDNNADIVITEYELKEDSVTFKLNLFDENVVFESNLLGKFNLYNLLNSIIVAKLCNIRVDSVTANLKTIKPLSGRFNLFENNGVKYVIDYAHTPDSLQNLLIECRRLTSNKIILVFGAGGNRDKDKRFKMGQIAYQNADICIITSDNPRCEKPMDIISDIAKGCGENAPNIHLIENRKLAIKKAISLATSGDTVILAGKGAEEYIEQNGQKYPYSDKQTLEELLKIIWK